METSLFAAAAAAATESSGVPGNWFDLVVAVLLGWGIYRGRKRGMSEELLSLMQVLAMLVVGSLYYQPVGDYVAGVIKVPTVYAYMMVYILILLFNGLVFLAIKRVVGEKLVGSDIFGRLEYYLGMASGMLRYAGCILMVMAIMNAPVYTQQEADASLQKQTSNLGSNFFPTAAQLQQMVLHDSLYGKFAQRYLDLLLIKPTPTVMPAQKHQETLKEKREREVNKAISK